MKLFWQLTILLAMLLTAGGCRVAPRSRAAIARGGETSTNAPIEVAEVDPFLAQRAEALARFAAGISDELNEKPREALDQFHRAALADPANESLVFELSRRYLQNKDTTRALELLSKATNNVRASGTVYSWLARALMQDGRTNDAVWAAQTGRQRSPDSFLSHEMYFQALIQAGRWPEALLAVDEAAARPDSTAVFLMGVVELYSLYSQTRSDESEAIRPRAVRVVDRALALDQKNPNLRLRLAGDLGNFGETKRAAEIYLQLLQEYPALRDVLREKLANIYLKDKDHDRAMEQLEAIVRENPTRYPQVWYFLGSLAQGDKKYDKAAEFYRKAIELNRDMDAAYYDLAGTEVNRNQPQEALRVLEQARERFPRSFIGEFFTGLAYNRLKNYGEAIRHLTSAEVIARASEPARLTEHFYFQLGATYERNKDRAEAEKYFQKAIDLSPNFAEALNYLGYMWAERGEKLAKAQEYIERALKIEPKNAAFLDSMGWVLFKLNKPAEALGYIQKSIELEEEKDAALFDHLGDVYLALKENVKARAAWQKSLDIEASPEIKKKMELATPAGRP